MKSCDGTTSNGDGIECRGGGRGWGSNVRRWGGDWGRADANYCVNSLAPSSSCSQLLALLKAKHCVISAR